jgi:hypothetical protein
VCLIGFIIYIVVLGGLLSMVMGGAALTQSMF